MLKEGMFIQDRYEIISKIGSGGMADVYNAKDHTLNRFVAVKVLKPDMGTTPRVFYVGLPDEFIDGVDGQASVRLVAEV